MIKQVWTHTHTHSEIHLHTTHTHTQHTLIDGAYRDSLEKLATHVEDWETAMIVGCKVSHILHMACVPACVDGSNTFEYVEI